MDIRKLTEDLSVTGQISPQDVDHIASLGFRSIICNRPDQEEAGQPAYEGVAVEAAKHGLALQYLPVRSSAISDVEVENFDGLLSELPKPILAYCRSGTRCTVLWSLAQAPKMPLEDILEHAAEAGYDMHGLVPRLQARKLSPSD